MDNGYSLSDLRAATGDGNGFGNGAWWIVILFLFCFMGNGWNRNSDFGQYATAASQQEILFGQQFGQLNDRITNLGNGICNLGYEMQGNIGQLGKEVALGQASLNQNMLNGFCGVERSIDRVNANIDQKFAALEKTQLEQRIAQLEQANSQLYMAQQFTGVVRYPMSYAYSAGNSPFCGGCCN